MATREKEEARQVAEKIVRKMAAVIRVNEEIDAASKVLLRLRERPVKVKQQPVPAEPPSLKFVRALHEGGGAVPVHELAFGEFHASQSSANGGIWLTIASNRTFVRFAKNII